MRPVMNLPNKLTLSRCVMALIFVAIMTVEHVATYALGFVLFVVASITDYYDGKIARERNLITNFGKLLDPVADKVLMVAAFLMMIKIEALRIPSWAIVIILAREYIVTGARALAASEGQVIAAINSGKLKTVLQIVYVGVFLFMATLIEGVNYYPELEGYFSGGDAAPWIDRIGIASLVSIILVSLYTVYSGLEFGLKNKALFIPNDTP